MEENNNVETTPVVEPSKKKGNVGLIVFLVILVLGLAGYICYDKFFAKEPAKPVEKGNKKETTKPEEIIENDDNLPDEDGNCEWYKHKSLTLDEFNKTYYKDKGCNRYIISDLNMEVVDEKVLDYEDGEYVHRFIVTINGKDNRELVETSGIRVQFSKIGNYIVARSDYAGSDIMEVFVYNENGELAYHIPTADSNNCIYLAKDTIQNVIVYQDFATNEEIMASNTCDAKNLNKSFTSYCSKGNYLRIYYKLEEVNGKLELVEQSNFECSSVN
jgi:hypothetical protein